MNIFATSPDYSQCAQDLDDKRVIKMILETSQLLSTAVNFNGGKAPYKSTHANHPCSIWARETRPNYKWLTWYLKSLCFRYKTDFNKEHKCAQFIDYFDEQSELIPDGKMTPFPNCTIYKDISDTHLAYRKYLVYKWNTDKRKPTWHREHLNPLSIFS